MEGKFSFKDFLTSRGSIATLRARGIAANALMLLGYASALLGSRLGIIALGVLAIVMYLLCYLQLARSSRERGFVEIFIAAFVLSSAARLISGASAADFVAHDYSGASAFGLIAGFGLQIASAICLLVVDFKCAAATGVRLFRVCGWMRLFAFAPAFSAVLSLGALVVEIVAWCKVWRLVTRSGDGI